MTPSEILKGKDFMLISEVITDVKKRVTLKKVKRAGKSYRIYANSLGQIILDPMVTLPASELWLHANKHAIGSVRQGLKESAEGRLVKKPSLAKHAHDELE